MPVPPKLVPAPALHAFHPCLGRRAEWPGTSTCGPRSSWGHCPDPPEAGRLVAASCTAYCLAVRSGRTPHHAAIHEHLVNIIDIFRHLQRQRAVLACLHIVLNVDAQSIPRIAGVARKSALGPSRNKAAVAGDRVVRSRRRRQVHRAPGRIVEVRSGPLRLIASVKFPWPIQRRRGLAQCDLCNWRGCRGRIL